MSDLRSEGDGWEEVARKLGRSLPSTKSQAREMRRAGWAV